MVLHLIKELPNHVLVLFLESMPSYKDAIKLLYVLAKKDFFDSSYYIRLQKHFTKVYRCQDFTSYRLCGELHRLDGPALITYSGNHKKTVANYVKYGKKIKSEFFMILKNGEYVWSEEPFFVNVSKIQNG